jgi:hypothetical protein
MYRGFGCGRSGARLRLDRRVQGLSQQVEAGDGLDRAVLGVAHKQVANALGRHLPQAVLERLRLLDRADAERHLGVAGANLRLEGVDATVETCAIQNSTHNAKSQEYR